MRAGWAGEILVIGRWEGEGGGSRERSGLARGGGKEAVLWSEGGLGKGVAGGK